MPVSELERLVSRADGVMDEVDDTQATAKYLKVPPRTMEDWRYRGVGPAFIKVGKAVRYRRDDVDAWLSEQTTVPSEVA
jgi:excisionase family DNA binding protein